MLLQPPPEAAQTAAAAGEAGAEHAAEGFNAGETIIEHVANSSVDHPLIHLPKIFGVDMSVTKHVLMLWIVATLLFAVVTWIVRRYVRQERLIPSGAATLLEIAVEFVRDTIVTPNVGHKWSHVWTPMILTLFLFILFANLIGIIPVFDTLALLNHWVVRAPEESFFSRALHGGVTSTGNYNVTAALATITFFAIIVAGSRAHGFVKHWKNMVPTGLPWPIYILLIPIEIMGMFVRPFALTMRLAANMTGGHIAVLAILSFVFIFTELFGHAFAGIGVGMLLSVPLAVGILALEIIVILVQAYVFTLLTAVFIGMAIHAHH
jgi:F-type H+-transporting ATPase subunit a